MAGFMREARSYNHAMPGRWAIVIAGVVIVLRADGAAVRAGAGAQGCPESAAAYVERFHQQLSQIVSEETYTQTIVNTARISNTLLAQPTQRLRSDLILVKPSAAERFVELRDVFEVNGSPVRDREARLESLLRNPQRRRSPRRDPAGKRAVQHRQHHAQHQHPGDAAAVPRQEFPGALSVQARRPAAAGVHRRGRQGCQRGRGVPRHHGNVDD